MGWPAAGHGGPAAIDAPEEIYAGALAAGLAQAYVATVGFAPR